MPINDMATFPKPQPSQSCHGLLIDRTCADRMITLSANANREIDFLFPHAAR